MTRPVLSLDLADARRIIAAGERESAVKGFFLNHSDFLAKLEDLTGIPQGPTGLEAWPDILVRLTRAPVVSIALIRGRATGNGSELALACDMSFVSRENAVHKPGDAEDRLGFYVGGKAGSLSAIRSRAVSRPFICNSLVVMQQVVAIGAAPVDSSCQRAASGVR